LLHNIDSKWVDYLHNIDLLREGIQLRAYGQRDPLQEYKREAFNMFNQLLRSIQADSIQQIFRAQPQNEMNLPDEFAGITFENLPEGMTEEDMMKIIQQIQEIQAGMGLPDGFIPIEGLEMPESAEAPEAQEKNGSGNNGNGNGSHSEVNVKEPARETAKETAESEADKSAES
jgi:preprotein translocase subunit SecA